MGRPRSEPVRNQTPKKRGRARRDAQEVRPCETRRTRREAVRDEMQDVRLRETQDMRQHEARRTAKR